MKRIMYISAAVVVGLSTLALGAPTSSAAPGKVTICPALDSGKIDVDGDDKVLEITAPEGFLIDGYCAKAGTTTVFVEVDPPQETIEITVGNGKGVSHYSLSLVPDEGPSS